MLFFLPIFHRYMQIWYVHVCMHVSACVWKCMDIYAYGYMWSSRVEIKNPSWFLFHLTFLRQSTSIKPRALTNTAGLSSQLALGIPVSIFQGWNCGQAATPKQHFPGDLNSCPLIWAASPLTTGPSPQPQQAISRLLIEPRDLFLSVDIVQYRSF